MPFLTLSAIVPALNEEKNIRGAVLSVIKAMEVYGITGEIIVINDGSTDRTLEIVNDLIKEYPFVRIISHKTPMGIGYSFWEGTRNAIYEIVVMFPGDDENDPMDALSFYDLMDRVDIMVPFIHNQEVRNKKRRILSAIYRLLINLFFGINLNYTNGTVFYRRSVLNEINLLSFGFFFQAEILIKLIRKGYLYVEVPNFLSKRNSGKSKAITLKSLVAVMGSYLRLFYHIYFKKIELRKDYKNLDKNSVSFKKCLEKIS
ncbi:MAG: glycosyltransferase family 2 protein [Candidatus Brocadia sinica]|nr:glycosyltransferase family 2 protein [Candidatus Brocadia sinica]